MTCYFRHLKEFFAEAGITITKENKRDVDRVIHDILGVEYKNCSTTWKIVKERIVDDKDGFISEIKQKINF